MADRELRRRQRANKRCDLAARRFRKNQGPGSRYRNRASALLALELNADMFIILTGVEKVYSDYGKPTQKAFDTLTVEEANRYLHGGQFPKGSMGPKIEAAIAYVSKTGKRCLITAMETLGDALKGKTGTWIVN